MYTVLYMSSHRTQIYLTAAQKKLLDDEGRRQGRSMAELIREAVNQYLAHRKPDPTSALDASFGACKTIAVPKRDEWDRG